MKLLIVGSRRIGDFDLTPYINEEVTFILSGGAKGIDTVAEQYADKNRISKIILKPQYALYGRSAPLKRNEELVKLADKVLVIWDGESKGTNYTINYSKKLNKPVEVIIVKNK